jgi:two-component system nitrate/nitrite response regulator NarL
MKILLVDDHALFRAGLRMLLTTICPDATTFDAGSVSDAIAIAKANPELELCLLDLSFKNESGLSGLTNIKEAAPQAAVVVVSSADDSATIRACLDGGAMSFIPKSLGPDVLTRALQHVLKGTVYLPEQIMNATDGASARPTLTGRQRDVLRCLSRGLPTKLIARELSLSEHTVKEHIASLFQVLGVRNRTEAVIRGSQWRLLESVTMA